ncbi:MAG: hypothetical protein HDR23_02820 [Lachnospiraceae bacterium]|nr:hypothetical protein [Lachnospiraceae bacterium]
MEKREALFLTIDVGTTAVKVCAVTKDFEILTHKTMEYQLHTEGKMVTIPAQEYWKYVKIGILAVMKNCEGKHIEGITITTQGETMIPVDDKGNPLYDAVVWLDGRAGKQAEKINQLVSPVEFYQKTGVPECNELCPVSKLLWFMEEERKVYQKARYFLLLEDYIIFKLTGRAVTEKSLLSTTGYFNIVEDKIWDKILDKIGFDVNKIPPAMDCGEIVAEVSEDVAGELGFDKNTVVVTGAMDQVCGAIGAGNSIPGMLTETTGTALCIGKTIEKTPINTDYPIPVYRHYRKDLQLLLPVCMTAGMALKWFKDTFCEKEIEEAKQTGEEVYDLLNHLAEESQPLSGGIIMLPYLAGSLQPYQEPEFRGGFLGVGLESRKCDFVRALMEGVSFMLKENLLLLEQLGGSKSDYLVSMGGGSRSDIWCQIKANVTGLQVRTLKESETASVGAAMLCSLGLSRLKSLQETGTDADFKEIYEVQQGELEQYWDGYERYSSYLSRLIG